MPIPIIFDTDPGVDDAQAIAIALAHPEIELLGLTTTFGNVTIEVATHNALLLAELYQQMQQVDSAVLASRGWPPAVVDT